MQDTLELQAMGILKISDADTKEIIVHKKNAIHPQNFARIIARGLAREPNSYIRRMAFGNGGTYVASDLSTIFNSANDGTVGGWEARLYNETYSEIIDEDDVLFGVDIGSAEIGNIRPGGGSSPDNDPTGGGVSSQEVGLKSNIIIRMFLNKDEPTGQIDTQNTVGPTVESDEKCFLFDEIGLYSPGKPAADSNGYTRIDVGNLTSDSELPNILSSVSYYLNITVDGIERSCTITTPATGSGSLGELTFGDLCEGINTGSWITSGDDLSDYLYFYITDYSSGNYPTITAKQSFGFLNIQSLTTGTSSSVIVNCDDDNASEFFNVLTGSQCASCNINPITGDTAGVQNDSANPGNERERLLTHVIFDPIMKTADRALEIEYTITVSLLKSKTTTIVN